MEYSIVLVAVLVCGTAWDVARRWQRRNDLTSVVCDVRGQLMTYMESTNEALAALRAGLDQLSIDVVNAKKAKTYGPAVAALSDRLDQACREWREVFAGLEAKNDENRKELMTKVAGALQAVPRPGFNR